MKTTFIVRIAAPLAFAYFHPSCPAAEIAHPSPAASPEHAFTLLGKNLATRSAGKTDHESFPLFFRDLPSDAALAKFHFEWLDTAEPVREYQRRFDPRSGIATTRFERSSAGFTATSFISHDTDLFVLHLRTDKPGQLSFRTRLSSGDAQGEVEDRRILKLPKARAWIFPMESEVSPGEHEISVHGEGEALILVAATNHPKQLPISKGHLATLGFGNAGIPDLHAVWTRLLARQESTRHAAPASSDESR